MCVRACVRCVRVCARVCVRMCVLGWKPWQLVFQLKYLPSLLALVPETASVGAKQAEEDELVIRSLADQS